MRVRDESNASMRRVECEYVTRLECDVTLELYRMYLWYYPSIRVNDRKSCKTLLVRKKER